MLSGRGKTYYLPLIIDSGWLVGFWLTVLLTINAMSIENEGLKKIRFLYIVKRSIASMNTVALKK